MPKCGLKPKAISEPCHNLYSYRLLGLFLGSSKDFLRTAKVQDPEDKAIDDIRRRSWTCEQKLGAIKYATSTYVLGKTGSDKLTPNNAAALNIGCTPKMLRTWIWTYNEINASPKGSWKNRHNTIPKESEIEQELYKLFI
jgi:hypothetical protein